MLGRICQNVGNHAEGVRLMASLQDFIITACTNGTTAPKKTQMQIVRYMQDWVAEEINRRLEAHNLKIRAKSKEHRFIGGWRSVGVDVHVGTREMGLSLLLTQSTCGLCKA